jgi:hypothetical protein
VALIRDALKGRPGSSRTSLGSGGIGSASIKQIVGDPSPPPGGASRFLYDTLLSLGEDVEPTTIMLDASNSAQAIYGLFGRMRDTIWRLPHHWLVAIDDGDRATALKPPADAFFDTVIELSPLPIERLLMVLHKRTEELEPELLAQIGRPQGMLMAELLDLGQASPIG